MSKGFDVMNKTFTHGDGNGRFQAALDINITRDNLSSAVNSSLNLQINPFMSMSANVGLGVDVPFRDSRNTMFNSSWSVGIYYKRTF
jgi:hypothetical protein